MISSTPPREKRGQAFSLAVVVIGRNEGERLKRCLEKVRLSADHVVYVDSASSDGSPEYAHSLGVDVVELDMSQPFSAARARNAGFERLIEVAPGVRYVQFIDGDCEIDAKWLSFARGELDRHEDWAIVCGRRRERFPEASLYNRLCDVEWDTPIGEATACGGDFLIDARVFSEVGGFNPTVIAGEEPELCHRIRATGRRIFRLSHEMTLHDAAMTRLSQWCKRVERAGYAFALVCVLHLRSPRRIWVKQVLSIIAWAALPLVLATLAWFIGPVVLWGFSLYPLLWLKTYRHLWLQRRLPVRLALAYATACVLGKFLEFRGVLRAFGDLVLRRQRQIIEYKNVGAAS